MSKPLSYQGSENIEEFFKNTTLKEILFPNGFLGITIFYHKNNSNADSMFFVDNEKTNDFIKMWGDFLINKLKEDNKEK